MPRYIDAIELVKAIEENQRNTEHHKDDRAKQIHVSEHRHFIKMVYEQPTADVVPRAVIAEIFADIDRLLAINFCSCLPSGATEHYNYFEGDLADDVAEIKKKYTEGKT